MDDPRFQKFLKDPRSRNIPRDVKKVKVDKRFKQMFNTKNFKDSSRLDERGRKLDLTSSENFKKLYNVESDSSEEDEKDKTKSSATKSESKIEIAKPRKIKAKQTELFHKDRLQKSKITDSLDIQEDISQSVEKFKSKKQMVKKKVASVAKETEGDDLKESVVSSEKDKSSDLEKSEDSEASDDSDSEESEHSISEEGDNSDSEEGGDSDSEDSDDSDSDDGISDKKGEFDHRWEELHEEAPDTDEISRRLAVCNMDWDRIRADDLFTVFNSFKPPDSVVHSVKIYPSEYGSKRMEEEKLNGPSELVEETLDTDEEEDIEDKKGSKYHIEKLRQYQINRLRYYYAVVECDTPETANSLYEQLNGMEYESSSVRFDLRFIPDDVTFDQEPSSISDKVPDPTEYKPRLFVTTALQQVKVNLTWDETDPKRRETLQKAFTEPESIEKDIKDYLASSSGESEVEQSEEENEEGVKISTKDRIAKYKQLLQSLEEKEKKEEDKYEMEITWEPGLKEKAEKIVKEKLEETDNPFEEMLKKKKEDRKLKRKGKGSAINEDEDNNTSNEGSDSDSFFKEGNTSQKIEEKDSKKIDELYLLSDSRKLVQQPQQNKSKRKRDKKIKKEEIQEVKYDVMDPRFSALYTSADYNIDPSDPQFKRTEGNLAFIQEKQNRLKNKESSFNTSRKSKKFKYNH